MRINRIEIISRGATVTASPSVSERSFGIRSWLRRRSAPIGPDAEYENAECGRVIQMRLIETFR